MHTLTAAVLLLIMMQETWQNIPFAVKYIFDEMFSGFQDTQLRKIK
jgi:hypothetical protein